MSESSSPNSSGQVPGEDALAPEVQPIPLSGGSERDEGNVQAQAQEPEPQTALSNRKSFWGKTKEALNEVSKQTSSVGNAVASKTVALGKSSAAKTAEIGKQTYAVTGNATLGALESGKQAYAGSKLESAVNFIDGELDQRGVKQALTDTTEAVVGKLDQVTGKRLLELLEEKLQVQDAYNDILATRLAEALERIAKLEAALTELAAGTPTSALSSSSEPETSLTRSQP